MPEHPFSRRIELANSSLVINDDYAIERRRSDGVHQGCTLALCSFGVDALGDVEGDSAHQHRIAFPVENRKALDMKAAHAIGRRDFLGGRDPAARFKCNAVVRQVALRVRSGKQLLRRMTDNCVCFFAEDSFGTRVDVVETPLQVFYVGRTG